nr:MAG TPA: hypothetical protein [Bacteriophage sp.]
MSCGNPQLFSSARAPQYALAFYCSQTYRLHRSYKELIQIEFTSTYIIL